MRRLILLLLGFLTVFPSLSYADPLPPSSFNVNTTTDSVDANPGDGVCADINGQCSLRAAIMEANTWTTNITINVPAGTYKLAITYGAEEDASASNDLDITNSGSIVIAGAGTGQEVVIDASAIAHRVFDVLNGAKLYLKNLTVTKGYSSVAGGGIRVNPGGLLDLDHVVITQNSSVNGGGIWNAGTVNGTLVAITSNTASNAGGGIYLDYTVNNPVTLTRSLIDGNSATDLGGGGIYNGAQGSYSSPVGGHLHLENVTVSNNRSSSSAGGGIYLQEGSSSYFVNCTIVHNSNGGSYAGAGVMGNGANSFFFLNTLIAGNTNSEGINNCYQIGQNSLGWKDLNPTYFDQGVPWGYNMSDDSTCGGFTTSGDIRLESSLTTVAALAGVGTYKLQAGSDAINAGDSTHYAAVDVFGTSRPQETAPDIGAYEFVNANQPPTTPQLTGPANGSSVYGTSIRLYWQKSTDPDGNHVFYILQIAEDSNFTVNLRTYSIDENGNIALAILLPFVALLGWRRWGTKQSLMLTAVGLLLASAIFVGCSSSGGSFYIGNMNHENTISYELTGLDKGKTYYWRVTAQDDHGATSAPSEVRSFTTR
jgi:CSLREA domain-containing protein